MYNQFNTMNLNNLGRLYDDSISVNDRTLQSLIESKYRMTNFHLHDPTPVTMLATQEVNVISQDGYGVGARGIDVESDLKIGATQTHPNCPIRAQPRPIKTVPYMGSGRGNPYVESLLQKSETIRDRKSIGTVTDSFFENQFTPMIPQLARNIQDPRHYIEALNDPAWVRGGSITRNVVRDRLCEMEGGR
jgi:hypothetical protein